MNLPIFLIPILCGLIAQALKPLFNKKWFSYIKANGYDMPSYGGMPSAHTAFVVSLATIVGLVDGVLSTSFAITAAVVIFILDDALRMRIFLGKHGEALGKLIKKLPSNEQKDFPHLASRLGHKPTEVLAGGLLGFVLATLTFFLLSYF